jgi:hypothetical protein
MKAILATVVFAVALLGIAPTSETTTLTTPMLFNQTGGANPSVPP